MNEVSEREETKNLEEKVGGKMEEIRTKYVDLEDVTINKTYVLQKIYTKLKKSIRGNYYMVATIYCSDGVNNYGVNIPLDFTRAVDGVKTLVKEGILTSVTFTDDFYRPIEFK